MLKRGKGRRGKGGSSTLAQPERGGKKKEVNGGSARIDPPIANGRWGG